MGTKKLIPGGAAESHQAVSVERLQAADEFERLGAGLSARAAALRAPELEPDRVDGLLGFLEDLRSLVRWTEVIGPLAKIHGDSIRRDGEKLSKAELTRRAKAVISVTHAPPSVKVVDVERLILAYVEATGGAGRHDGAGKVETAFVKITGKKRDSVRRRGARARVKK